MQAQPDDTRRATISDIASAAGVSTATVDRVLNGRSGVKANTLKRVMDAAAMLGYVDAQARLSATPSRLLRIAFILPAGTNRYLGILGRMIVEQSEALGLQGIKPVVEYIKSFSPEILATTLLRHGKSADGICFMALEHPAVREAVNHLSERGIPTVTLISDLGNAPRNFYLGLDNRSAGRLAGDLIARFLGSQPAKVAMIAGSLSYRAHEEREMGFLHIMQEMHPQIEVVGLREGHDDETMTYRQMRMLLSQHPDLKGIYNIGGGASGVGHALKDAMRSQQVVFIGHGLTPDTRAYLIDGTMDAVITQNPSDTIARAATIFSTLLSGSDAAPTIEPLRSEVIFRENLP